jgi:hypothetical protein
LHETETESLHALLLEELLVGFIDAWDGEIEMGGRDWRYDAIGLEEGRDAVRCEMGGTEWRCRGDALTRCFKSRNRDYW